MEHLIEIMERITLEEIAREYAGKVSPEEERRIKYDLKHRPRLRIRKRRQGWPPKKVII